MSLNTFLAETIGSYELEDPLYWQRGPVYGPRAHELVNTLIDEEAAERIRNFDPAEGVAGYLHHPKKYFHHEFDKDEGSSDDDTPLTQVRMYSVLLPKRLPQATPVASVTPTSFPNAYKLPNFRTQELLSGTYLLDDVTIFSEGDCKSTADIRLHGETGISWFVNGNLTLSEGAVLGVPDGQAAHVHMRMYVKGNLHIEEGTSINLSSARIVVVGDFVCEGTFNIEGELVMIGEIKVKEGAEFAIKRSFAEHEDYYMNPKTEDEEEIDSSGWQYIGRVDLETHDHPRRANIVKTPEQEEYEAFLQQEKLASVWRKEPIHDQKGQPDFLKEDFFYIDPRHFREMSPFEFLDIQFAEKDIEKGLKVAGSLLRYYPYFPYDIPSDSSPIVFHEESFPSSIHKPAMVAFEEMIGNHVFGGVKIYGRGNCFYDAKIALHGKKGLRWYVDGSLIMSKDSEIKPAEGWEEDGSFLDLYVSGNLRIREGCRIHGIKARIIVLGMLVCDGEVDIEGGLYAMSGESGKTEPRVRKLHPEDNI